MIYALFGFYQIQSYINCADKVINLFALQKSHNYTKKQNMGVAKYLDLCG
jgi:hypothetical protein